MDVFWNQCTRNDAKLEKIYEATENKINAIAEEQRKKLKQSQICSLNQEIEAYSKRYLITSSSTWIYLKDICFWCGCDFRHILLISTY
jgi:ABC-type Zn uptake system ZnuABC Zn-binding protein ZnuA